MQEPYNKVALVAMLAVCLVASAYVAMPFYTRHRDAVTAEANRYRPPDAIRQLLQSETSAAPALTGQYPCVVGSVTDSGLRTELAQCGSTAKPSGPIDRFEVDLRYGNFILRQSDLYLNDVFAVPLTRTYNSGDSLAANRVHAFGRNANHPYDIAPVGSRFPYTYQMLVLEDGNFIYFPRVSQGTSYSDAVYQHTETSSEFYKAVTSWNGGGWTTWLADGSLMVFPEAYGAKNAAQGAPIEMRDAAGNKLGFVRDGDRNLQEIRTPHDHTIKFEYDDETRITRAEDDQGHSTEYRYDGYGMLTDAVSSSGRARHYSYDGDLMTAIRDEHQNVLVRNTYNYRQLVRQEFGNGQTYSYNYTFSDTRTYTESVNVMSSDGTTTHVETGDSVPDAIKHPPQ